MTVNNRVRVKIIDLVSVIDKKCAINGIFAVEILIKVFFVIFTLNYLHIVLVKERNL